MMDFGCHRIEVLMHIFGPITSAVGVVGNVLFDRDVEDTAIAVFGFERGLRATLAVTHAALEPQDTLDICCSDGSIHIPVLNRGEMHIKTAAGERTESHPPYVNVHQPLIEDFTRAVLGGREPTVGGDVGREVARIEEEVYAASGTGRPARVGGGSR